MASNPKPLQRKHRQALLAELVARARSRLPEWRPGGDGQDLAYTLFEIAARLGTEVEQRLDQVPEKNRRGFMHWLGLRGQAGRAARAPVVFSMVRGAEAIDAPARVQLQANAVEPPVTLETEHPLRILPARLRTLVASSPRQDEFSIAPAPLLALEGPGQGGTRWTITRVSSTGDEAIAQANPPQGLERGLILQDENGRHHEVIDSNNGLIRLRPAPDTTSVNMTLADRFQPFAGGKVVIDRQTHALYIGDEALLDLSTEATITIGGTGIGPALLQAEWAYWGTEKDNRDGPSVWCPLKPAPSRTQADISITLTKSGNGIIKALGLGGRTSRWLRAQPKPAQNLSPLDGPAISDLSLAVTVENDKATNICEGIANTTPLVLKPGFYPLGREPRQFDAFYLGSDEAFSKKGAVVTLDLTLGDQFATPFFRVDASSTCYFFSIGNDGKLKGYRIENGTSSTIDSIPIPPPLEKNGQAIPFRTDARPGAVFIENSIYVAAIAQNEKRSEETDIWILILPTSSESQMKWQELVTFPLPTDDKQTDCVLLHNDDDNALCIYAITADGISRWTATIEAFSITRNDPPLTRENGNHAYQRIAPVFDLKRTSKQEIIAFAGKAQIEIIGIDPQKKEIKSEEIKSEEIASAHYPIGVFKESGGKEEIHIYYLNANSNPTAIKGYTNETTPVKSSQVASSKSALAIIKDHNDRDLVLFTSYDETTKTSELHAWPSPLEDSNRDSKQVSLGVPVPAGITEGPVATENRVILSTTDGRLRSAAYDHNDNWRPAGKETWRLGIEKKENNNAIYVATVGNNNLKLEKEKEINFPGINPILLLKEKKTTSTNSQLPTLFEIGKKHTAVYAKHENSEWKIYNAQEISTIAIKNIENYFFAKIVKNNTLEFIGAMPNPENKNNFSFYSYSEITPNLIKKISTLSDFSIQDPLYNYKYFCEEKNASNEIKFDGMTTLDSKVFFLNPSNWGTGAPVIAHRPLEWANTLAKETRNPKLSWEYWNGRSWWQIEKTTDKTGNLINTGTITITTPDDIEPTDVLGRRNHWIRARLVGGDYGEARTTVTLETDSKDKNKQHQTIHRDPDSINAPYVAALKLAYTTSERSPQAVLTHDNGSWHDQSAAARTTGASLQCFVSLASALTAREADPQGDEGPWQQRGLYLGFDAPLSGQGLSLFCLVDTPADDAPDLRLALDVLGKDGFRPVTGLQDGTGGLQQSGTLVFNLSETPVAAELFGQSAWWLRLRTADPTRESDWNPILRGAWLNGAWAIAADTLTMEILGSASGAPSQSVRLTHSPVVEGSLELRVREPLGDEEVAALLAEDADAVRHNVADRPGIWVRWHEVDDIDDATQGQRAYALDDANGEIRFGDGVHGRAPDGGQDAIVAFSYRRGGGALANGIKAWSPTNLSTPLQGVDNCQIVDAAAAGSDAQDGERALAFAPARLHTRERALTLADLENLTRQFSPDIAQARAWSSGQQTRLVVVMARRGSPEPDRGTLRELKKYLVDRSLPGLVRHLGLRRPRQRPLTVLLQLWADDLGLSGQLEAKAYQRIEQLLDPASGGLDQQGWPLGCAPSEADIAAALDDLGDGCGLTSVEIRDADGKHAPPPLARDELVTLAPKGVRCEITQGGTASATRQEGPCHA